MAGNVFFRSFFRTAYRVQFIWRTQHLLGKWKPRRNILRSPKPSFQNSKRLNEQVSYIIYVNKTSDWIKVSNINTRNHNYCGKLWWSILCNKKRVDTVLCLGLGPNRNDAELAYSLVIWNRRSCLVPTHKQPQHIDQLKPTFFMVTKRRICLPSPSSNYWWTKSISKSLAHYEYKHRTINK